MIDLIIVSNRSVLDFRKEDLEKKKPPKFGSGGLAQAMLWLLKKNSDYNPLWISSSGGDADVGIIEGEYDSFFRQLRKRKISPNFFPDVDRKINRIVDVAYKEFAFSMRKIDFPKVVTAGFYDNFSNGFLWGLMHDTKKLLHLLPEYPAPSYEEIDWDYYLAANIIFADVVRSTVRRLTKQNTSDGKEIIVWWQDYHTMRAAMTLKDELAISPIKDIKVRSGHFIHTPYPDTVGVLGNYFRENYDIGNMFLKSSFSLLGNNFIGFQIPEYAKNFIESILHYVDLFPKFWKRKKIIQVREMQEGQFQVTHANDDIISQTVVGAYPIGVAAAPISKSTSLDQLLTLEESILDFAQVIQEDKKNGRTVFGGIERFDFTKGIPYKLNVFRNYLNLYGNARLIQVSEPSREKNPAYKDFQRIVQQEITSINSYYGNLLGYQPILHVKKGAQKPENYRFMRDIDCLMITPEADGMNLVVFEGIISKDFVDYHQRGIIVLGNCGASHVLRNFEEKEGLVRISGLHPKDAAMKIKYAIIRGWNVSNDLISYVKKNCDVESWAKKNIHSIRTGEYLGFE